jgi:hypothetical protein
LCRDLSRNENPVDGCQACHLEQAEILFVGCVVFIGAAVVTWL